MQQVKTVTEGFHLKEFDALRTELLSLVEQINQVERNVVIGTAVVYSWLAFSNEGLSVSQSILVWFIPLFFTLLGSLKVYMLKFGIMEIARYLYQLEELLGIEDTGWQHFREQRFGKGEKPFASYIVFSIAFWGVLFAVNIALPLLMVFSG